MFPSLLSKHLSSQLYFLAQFLKKFYSPSLYFWGAISFILKTKIEANKFFLRRLFRPYTKGHCLLRNFIVIKTFYPWFATYSINNNCTCYYMDPVVLGTNRVDEASQLILERLSVLGWSSDVWKTSEGNPNVLSYLYFRVKQFTIKK